MKEDKMTIRKHIFSTIAYIGAVGVSIALLFFVIACTWIGFEVKNSCQLAKQKYHGDCVEALSSVIDDDTMDFRTRNTAIWAIGQFGDARAVLVLEKHYTGNIPNREPLDKTISQYELKKAINLAKGGTNISAFIWRSGSFGEK